MEADSLEAMQATAAAISDRLGTCVVVVMPNLP